MIYQFKVNLKNAGVPVWRRLHVESGTTFKEMHYILMTAFEWEGDHLHEYEIRKSDGERVQNIRIGQDGEETQSSLPQELTGFLNFRIDQVLSEEKETLADWFKQEKDRVIYTYDFGDDWEHVLVLEEILEANPQVSYPLCVKAKNDTPPEDSRGQIINGEISLVNPDWKPIVAFINDQFQRESW